MSGDYSRTTGRRADLSQHFLRTARARALIDLTAIGASDYVIEIGAGRGALTRWLAERARAVRAIELDSRLAQVLAERRVPNVEVVTGDFLRQPLPTRPYTVVGNIPFSRSAEILRRLTSARQPPSDVWLVVQREFAWRLCGRPYLAESPTSLRLKCAWHAEIVAWLSPRDFEPPPAVETVFLWLARRPAPLLQGAALATINALLESCFDARGELIPQAVRGAIGKHRWPFLARQLKLDPRGSPADWQFEQWLGVARALAAS